MASIRKRTKANGDIAYDCTIIIKKHGVIVHRESKTFHKLKLAKDWGLRREVELQEKTVYKKAEYLPLKNVINDYISEYEPFGRTKQYSLKRIMAYDIANTDVNKLTIKDLAKHIKMRNQTCSPQTARGDLIWIKTVVTSMSATQDIKLDLSIFDAANRLLRNEGLISTPVRRDRIPSARELLQLTRYLDEPAKVCMWFALYSGRRQAEITRLEWDDINHEHKTIMVRDLKHPTIKKLRKTAKLPRSAYKLIMKQERVSKYIFPYNPHTMGIYFSRACKMLDIDDLRFHDLRHAALTFYANKGLSLNELRLISLHDSYSTLQRYINLQAKDLDV
jgi:integrase